jgi:hypothetical protein
MLKFFTDKDAQQTIAINPALVKFVREFTLGTKVMFADGSYVLVDEPFLDVVARLNERSK